MIVSWQAVAVLVPIISALIVGIWRLACIHNRFDNYVKKSDCGTKHDRLKSSVTALSSDSRECFAEFREQIKTLFSIGERLERAVEKLESINRKNGGG